MPIRVLLSDDEALLRTGVRLILEHADDIAVVAEASDGAEAVADGHAILAPQLTRRILDRYLQRENRRAGELIAVLSEREHEVLVLVGAGHSNAEIAKDLFMGEGTVKTHVSRILTKLGCGNRVQASIIAHDAGILPDR
ncbi:MULTISPECIES: response regulator transcription factor [Streptosporangium]|uniref:DNA-binding NarL/FixJ family response regulator n=1 Tax=Streptosporangium brasiliense TaxID=47480 RepID=A0ABT9RJW8_9ACTN|nr:response regulator transcription factor [Streptosporangium brasiliense]MDP9869137.1 DNA-binding NarL/FixJ family response regulator [Streptosporangium brasiliense]